MLTDYWGGQSVDKFFDSIEEGNKIGNFRKSLKKCKCFMEGLCGGIREHAGNAVVFFEGDVEQFGKELPHR